LTHTVLGDGGDNTGSKVTSSKTELAVDDSTRLSLATSKIRSRTEVVGADSSGSIVVGGGVVVEVIRAGMGGINSDRLKNPGPKVADEAPKKLRIVMTKKMFMITKQ